MDYDAIENMLRRLRLPRIREVFREKLKTAAEDGGSLAGLLGNLLEDELSSRDESQLRSRVRRANFPFSKTLEQFDFRRHPELRRQAFQSYLDPSFVKEGHSLVLIGAPGLGKTHLAVAIGVQQALRGADVRFVRVQKLMARVLEAQSAREREATLKPLRKCGLLILDEFGYLLTDPETGPVLYDLVAERYEHSATLITSNKSLQEWGKVLGDSSLASALVDRLMHHGQVYYLKGESYRLKDKKANDGGEWPPEATAQS
jgi:DNA replication protein DnaC